MLLPAAVQAYQFFALHVVNGTSLLGFPVNVVTGGQVMKLVIARLSAIRLTVSFYT